MPRGQTQRTYTGKQAFTTDGKTLQRQKTGIRNTYKKHCNIDKDKWRQIKEAPTQSPPQKVTHHHSVMVRNKAIEFKRPTVQSDMTKGTKVQITLQFMAKTPPLTGTGRWRLLRQKKLYRRRRRK